MSWRRLNGERIERPIEEAVEQTLLEEIAAGHQPKVCIGTDSQVYSTCIEYATVIVFLRHRGGGFMFIEEEKGYKRMGIHERMIYEVSKSIDIAHRLREIMEKHNIKVEVHADINADPKYRSNSALNEAVGYIKGMGFEVKVKPDAFASTSCANRVV